MKKNTGIIIAVVSLVVGLGIGYQVGVDSAPFKLRNQNKQGTHMMSGGSMTDMMILMNAELKGKIGDVFDQAFLAEMIIHHQGAIEMAQLALTNAKKQEIKDLANKIISTQNKEISEMKTWQKNRYNQ